MQPGLTAAKAASRLAAEGANELPRVGSRTLSRIALEVIREPMFALLLGSGAIYLLLGELGEALLLLVFASLSVLIAIVQEHRSERVLEALRDLTSPRALVLRDGAPCRIPGREVVRGDILVLQEGDRIAADAVLLEGDDLLADEALLTGESAPVRKLAASRPTSATARPGGEDLPFVYAGTLVVRGHGLAEVRATGPAGEIGKIGRALGGIEGATPRLAAETRQLVRAFAVVGLGCSALAMLLYGLLRGSWLDAVLAGVALGMSMLPEEFPLVLTVFMVMGAWRISRANVLTRRAAAIEALGSATVLCTDKTGTLTQNRMAVAELRRGEAVQRLGVAPNAEELAPFARLIELGVLASARDAFDPMDRALHGLAGSAGAEPAGLALVRSWGLRPELLAVTQAWQLPGAARLLVAAKGAPEAIAGLCRLDSAGTESLRRQADDMASRGMRVLGVAAAEHAGANCPASPRDFDFRFAGLIGFADPLRLSVSDAVRKCRSAGIRVVMVTGDYPATARVIADEAGLPPGEAVTGDAVEAMPDAALARAVATTSVFARIMPGQKLRIVRALHANGEVVAMTGDGVNDAPALKAADIGVAMGMRGTDVAREAAALVLLDDDFGSIVTTVRLGRRIYDNLRKASGYILAVHVPIAGLSLLPLLTGLPIVFGPVHIAFLEMVIDPVCAIVFEAERAEGDIMRRPPRSSASALFSLSLVLWGAFQGCLALLLLAGIYLTAALQGMPEGDLRALVFVSLVLTNLGLVLVNRSFSPSLRDAVRRPNPALLWIAAATIGILGIAVYWPPARELFRFGVLHPDDLAVTAVAAATLVAALELSKRVWRRRLTV